MTNKKIIICDDQAIFRELTASYLQLNGWEVFRATSGAECVQLAEQHDVDLIMLDIHMPIMGGFETVKKLREKNLRAEVLFMTGYAPNTEDVQTYNLDNKSLLLKPFNLRNLQQIVADRFSKDKQVTTPCRILLVDDEDLLRSMLKTYLTKNGFDVISCKNGKECVETAQREKFGAILMDIRMPELDGLGALRKLREEKNLTPVILMSGFCELGSIDEAKERGAKAFLAKPFKPGKALELLREFTGEAHS